MLHLSTVESTTLELLKKLQQLPVLCNTRLVGGTALALQLGHRKSVDLDFFGQINVDSQDLKEALRTPDQNCFQSAWPFPESFESNSLG